MKADYFSMTGLKQKTTVFVLFAAPLFLVFWSGLSGKFFVEFKEGFAMTVHYPSMYFLSKVANTSGIFSSMWSTNYNSGFPIYLSQLGFWHPLYILFFRIFDYVFAYNLIFYINFLFAGVFTYVFCRNLFLSKAASIMAGLVFIFSEISMLWAPGHVFSNFIPFIPLFFLSVLKISRKENKYIFLGIFLTTLGFLGAFLEIVLLILISVFFFALFLDIRNFNKELRLVQNFNTFKKLILAAVIGIILALPVLLLPLNFSQFTARWGGVESSVRFAQFWDLAKFFHPFTVTSPASLKAVLPALFDTAVPLYVGILPLYLAIIAFINFRKNRTAQFFIGFVIFIFLMQIESSRVYWLFHKIPILNMSRGVWKWTFLYAFSMGILAGFGLDYLKESNFIFKRFLKCVKFFTLWFLIIAAIFNLIIFFWYPQILNFAHRYFEKNFYNATLKLPLDFYKERTKTTLDQLISVFSFTNYYFIISFIFILFSLVLFYLYEKEIVDYKKFQWLAVFAVIFNFVFIYQGAYQLIPVRFIKASPKIVSFFEEKETSKRNFRAARFFTVPLSYYSFNYGLDLNDQSSLMSMAKETLSPNLNIFYDVDLITGIENFTDKRQNLLMTTISHGLIKSDEERHDFLKKTPEEQTKIFTNFGNLLSMTNVKYIISSIEFKELGWRKVFEEKITKYDIPLYLYENSGVLPRVSFAKNAKFARALSPADENSGIQGKDQVFEQLLAIQDFKKQTLIECPTEDTLCQFSIFNSQFSNPDSIEIQELRPGYLRLKTKTTSPRWLVYSESNLPTWEARFRSLQPPTFNFQPLKIYAANYIYQAVFIPEGENEVIFEYPGLFRQMRYAIEELVF